MNSLFQSIETILLPLYIKIKLSCREWRRWRHAKGESGYRVYYGHNNFFSRDELVTGGVVKFQDLQELFPNCVDRPNILYLLNNYLPFRWDIVIKSAKKNGAKFVLNQNGIAYRAWYGPGWEEANRPFAFLLKEADYVFYQSEFCKVCTDRFLGTRKDAYEILYNPVDTDYFIPTEQHVSRIAGSNLRLLMAGTYHELYRIRVALQILKKVMSRVPDTHLTIAGNLAWNRDNKDAIKEMHGIAVGLGVQNNMRFIGSYTQNNAPEIYQNHHIFIHTKHNDPCPRVVVEALSCGLPVVYSSSGGLPEMVSSEAGIGIHNPSDWDIIHEPDPGLIAEAIDRITSKYDMYSKSARSLAVEKFDVKPWIRRHEEIFSKLLSS